MRLKSTVALTMSIGCAALWGYSKPKIDVDVEAIKNKLASQFILTTMTNDGSAIVTSGTIFELLKDGLLMHSTSAPLPPLSVYKNGKISQGMAGFGRDLGSTMLAPGNATTANYPQRRFVSGERVWASAGFVKKDALVIRLFSDVYDGVRYKADLKLPFEKGAASSPDDVLLRVAEVLRAVPANTDSLPEAAPPAPVPSPDPPPPPAPPAVEPTLQNEDIIKMAKAGLDDSVIVSAIKGARCRFQISADSLIELKRSGVSASVLKAMTEAAAAPLPPIRTQVPAGDVLPSSYGGYVFDGAKYQPLLTARINVVVGLSQKAAGTGIAVDGFDNELPQSPLSGLRGILIYQQNVDTAALHLSKLEFVGNLKAYEFNMMNTNPQFFRDVWGTDYNEVVSVKLWRPLASDVAFRTEPVAGRNGMFWLSPERTLAPGRYAIYFGQAVHPSGIIYATRLSAAVNTGYYFEIR